jgi:hypothetical protein
MQKQEGDSVYEILGKTLLVGSVGEAYEIAWAYLFLMQERYGRCETVVVDGGAELLPTRQARPSQSNARMAIALKCIWRHFGT